MPRKSNSLSTSSELELDDFDRQVETVLEHIDDSTWLGEQSPLAAPYFLGQTLSSTTNSGESIQFRGQILRDVLLSLLNEVEPELKSLLNIAFFQKNHKMDGTDLSIAMNVSRRTFYRVRARAIRALAERLNHRIQPALRLEQPSATRALVGREATIQHAMDLLGMNRSLYLFGNSGIGKTTLAATLTQRWVDAQCRDSHSGDVVSPSPGLRHVFWYTFRPTLNDHLSSFVFALAFFLYGLGATFTWRQLIADKGNLQIERVLSLIRYDLSILPVKTLCCFDEIDMLKPEVNEHLQILHLIEELRKHTLLLLLGLRVTVETDEQIKIEGLDENGVLELFIQSGLPHSSTPMQQQLVAITGGNPALLVLVMALLRSGAKLDEIITDFPATPSLEALFLRIWRRFNEIERICLMQLSVYRSVVPRDAFLAQQPTVNVLLENNILQKDGQGGIFVLPHIRHFIYQRIPDPLKTTFHIQAGTVRRERSQIVAALYHALQANQPEYAIWLWFNNRSIEIEHGQALGALTLLSKISVEMLKHKQDQIALHIARAELQKLFGNSEAAEKYLENVPRDENRLLQAYVRQLQGDVLEMQDRLQASVVKYREGLDALWGSVEHRSSILHAHLSYLYSARLQDSTQARSEAILARAEAEIRHGRVEERAGNYALALERFLAAYNLVQECNNDYGILSRSYSHLGKLYLKTGKLDEAIVLLEQAIELDHKRGDIVGPLYDRVNLSYAFTQGGRYGEALQLAEEGLKVAEKMKNSQLIAGLAAAASEVCYYLNQFESCERYALQSLFQEDEFLRPWALTTLGMLRGAQNVYDDAVRNFQAAIQGAHEIDDTYGEAYAWRKLGDLQRHNVALEQANNSYQNAIDLYTRLGLKKEMDELSALLA